MRRAKLTLVLPPVMARGQIFVKGKVVETVPEDEIVEALITRARAVAEELGLESAEGMTPDVIV